jgi:hypothetical protein
VRPRVSAVGTIAIDSPDRLISIFFVHPRPHLVRIIDGTLDAVGAIGSKKEIKQRMNKGLTAAALESIVY